MKKILTFIHQFRKRDILISLYKKLYILFIIFSLFSIFLFSLEKIFWQDQTARKLLFFLWLSILIIFSLYLLLYFIISYFSLFGNSTNEKYALQIGRYFPTIKDRLLNIIQLNRDNPKLDLVKLEKNKIAEKLNSLNVKIFFKSKLNRSKIITQFLLAVIIIVCFNMFFQDEKTRYIHYKTNFSPLLPFDIELNSLESRNGIYTSKENFYASDSILISYKINKNNNYKEYQLPDTILLYIKNESAIEKKTIHNDLDSTNLFSLILDDINTNSIIWTEYTNTKIIDSWDKIHSKKDSIKIRIRPKILTMKLEITPPEYSNIKPYIQSDNRITHFELLAGTKVAINITSNKELQKAWMKLNNSNSINLTTKNKSATGEFKFHSDTTLRVFLFDKSNDYNINPIQYHFHLQKDNAPNIIVTKPKSEFILDESYKIPFNINVYDDFGIKETGIEFQIFESGNYTKLDTLILKSFNKNHPTNLNFFDNWNIGTLPISMGDELHFWFYVIDNNSNKSSYVKSKKYIGKFPTLEDLFTEIESYENETTEIVENMKEDLEEILETIEDTELDLLKNSDLDWEEEKKIEESFDKVDDLYEEINKIQDNIEKIIEQAEKNDLFNDELMEKFNQFQNMLQEIMSEELLMAMEELQNAMNTLSPEEMLGALENFELNIENFEKELDRFIEMFELAEAEKKLNELAENLENMIQKQTELIEKINEDPTKINTLSALSDNQENRLDNFNNLLQETTNSIQEISPKISEKLDSLNNQNKKLNTKEKLNNTKQNIKSEQAKDALNNANLAKEDLQNIETQLKEIQETFKSEKIEELKNEYLIIIDNLLTTAYQQEQLIDLAVGLRGNNPMLQDINAKQNNINYEIDQIMAQLLSLANKTMFIDPSISKSFGSIKSQLNNIIANFAQKKVSQGRTSQTLSLNNINNTIFLLLDSLNELKNSESMSGLEQFLEAMEEMSQKQQGINQGTSQLNMLGPSQQQSMLEQLLQQQQQLKEQLEDLLGDNPGKDNGGMESTLDDMDEVIQDFKNLNIDSETIERQENILSKMLDSQKSLKQKEFSEKRKSKRANTDSYINNGPTNIPDNYGNKELMIIDAMENAMNEGFSKEYNMRIRNYFLNLNESNVNEK